MKLSAVTFILFPFLIFCLCVETTASSCEYVQPCQAYGPSDFIFIGRAIDGTEKLDVVEWRGRPVNQITGTVRFEVEKVFKGTANRSVKIEMSKSLCIPATLLQGEVYLIYTYVGNKFSKGKRFQSGRIALLENAQEDLDFLSSLPPAGTGGTLHGRVFLRDRIDQTPLLKGMTILAETEQHDVFCATVTEAGSYKFVGLKPGKYKVKPLWPDHFIEPYPDPTKVTLYDQGCAEKDFSAQIGGRLRGRVLDSRGVSAPVSPTLELADDKDTQIKGDYLEDGSYEIAAIPPGRYRLLLTFSHEEKEDCLFYPGVSERQQAAIIEIGLGEKLSGYDLWLPSDFEVVKITGYIRMPKGKPPGKARIRLSLESDRKQAMGADVSLETILEGDGQFSFVAFKGGRYKLQAREHSVVPIQQRRFPLTFERVLTLTHDIEELEVMLTEPPGTPKLFQNQNQPVKTAAKR